jgi:hypothetical protein
VTNVSQKLLKAPMRFLVALAPLVLVLGACGDSDDTSSSDTAASTAGNVPQLTFNGSDCRYEGPEEVTAGVVAVEYVNDSDGTSSVLVALLDEGTTAQDVIADDDETAGPFQIERRGLSDMGGQDPASAGETVLWEAGLAAGEYFVTCTTRAGVWFTSGTGLTVVNG